jgi:AcrR family transcriptional regulator
VCYSLSEEPRMRRKITLRPRKEPRQRRSREMLDVILEAGVRVLRREGALRFTTPRVAAAAGISVGSLYQYFPNKQALIFAIHSRVVARAWIDVQAILDHPAWGPREKLERIALLFFLAESADVAEMGAALQQAEIYFDEQPENVALGEQVLQRFGAFVSDALPATSRARVELATQMIVTVLESVGKAVARRGLSQRLVRKWARECAAMLANYVGFPPGR